MCVSPCCIIRSVVAEIHTVWSYTGILDSSGSTKVAPELKTKS
jgi:hypothetical protein